MPKNAFTDKQHADGLALRKKEIEAHRDTIEAVADMICKDYQITREQLYGRRKHQPIISARQVMMYVLAHITPLSYYRISQEFGRDDHSIVSFAIKRVNAEPAMMREVQQVRLRLGR